MKNVEIKCPNCGELMAVNKGGAFCDQCKIKIWRKVAKKEMANEELQQLIEKGKVFLKGPASKTGKEFEAYLVLSVSVKTAKLRPVLSSPKKTRRKRVCLGINFNRLQRGPVIIKEYN